MTRPLTIAVAFCAGFCAAFYGTQIESLIAHIKHRRGR